MPKDSVLTVIRVNYEELKYKGDLTQLYIPIPRCHIPSALPALPERPERSHCALSHVTEQRHVTTDLTLPRYRPIGLWCLRVKRYPARLDLLALAFACYL